MHAKDFIHLLKKAGGDWVDDNAMRLSAALAYYAVFSLAPLFIISISLAGMIFGEEAARGEITRQLSGMAGEQTAQSIEALIASASTRASGVWATIIGVVVLLFGASSVFGELRSALNTIWGVVPIPGRALSTLFIDRLLSFSMVLVIGFLLLASLVVSAFLAATSKFVGSYVSIPKSGWHALDLVISLIVITVLFAMIFKILPNAIVSWRDVFIGAWVTSLLFTVGKFLIGFYLGRSGVASTFGAAGSIVLILLWIYYSACILFFGAEFTKACACHDGNGVVPDQWAEVDPNVREAGAQPPSVRAKVEGSTNLPAP